MLTACLLDEMAFGIPSARKQLQDGKIVFENYLNHVTRCMTGQVFPNLLYVMLYTLSWPALVL